MARSTRTTKPALIGAGCLVLGSVIAYAAIPTILALGKSDYSSTRPTSRTSICEANCSISC